jgi:hypothetical protein
MSNLNWQPGMTFAQVEKSVLLQAFRFHRGNKSAAASALGIPEAQLSEKLNGYLNEEKEQERVTNEQRQQREEFIRRSRGIHPATPTAPGGSSIFSADAGVSVESTSESSEKSSVPMPERKEVQSVLPSSHSQGRHRRHR